MRFTALFKLASLTLLASFCSCTSTKLPNTQTAAEQFSVLGSREKIIARNFYDLGSGDAIKRLYWAQRRYKKHQDWPSHNRRQAFSANMWYCPCRNTSGRMEQSRRLTTKSLR
jgi:hypothetical protein